MKEPIFLNDAVLQNGVYILSPLNPHFEMTYLQTREKEGWLFSNTTVKNLPAVEKGKPNWKMWRMRNNSSTRLCNYLKKKNEPLNILEIGSGNGWFSNAMKRACPAANVFGLDINLNELKQAAEVFNGENIFWLYANLYETNLPKKYFDVIVLNASLQYFESLQSLLQRLFEILKEDGEIHLLDSPFYAPHEIAGAKKRSEEYFERINSSAMKSYYYHHSWQEVKTYFPQIFYSPNKYWNKFLTTIDIYQSPFHWLVIKKPTV
ncbi:MAG: methyltransferase domain-containing protein [Bacteroidetes bacterium]|nr:methyltransferase domain-containing protein [Bacteroidota bacterium]